MKKNVLLTAILALIILLGSVSALSIYDVASDTIAPGKEGQLKIILKNTLSDDVEDVTLSLDLANVPFTTLGGSSETQDEIQEGDRETFTFTLRADTSAKAGDYKIPYTITYKNASSALKGTIGVRISAKPEISYTASADVPVIDSKGKINLKIINKGLGEARFATLRITPQGYTLLSDSEVYIGSINSDDFETASFDVIFKSKSASLSGILEYSDLEGKKYSLPLAYSLNVYTQDEAVKQGIIKKNNAGMYVGLIILLIIIWLVYRNIAKRRRLKKSMQINSSGK